MLLYAAAAAVVLMALAWVVPMLVGSAEPAGVWLAAAIAWLVQIFAFWSLVAGRKGGGPGFMLAWGTGMVLRFGAVGAAAVWLTRAGTFDAPTALVSLVGFVFVLVLLEPLFLRLAD